MRFSLSPQGAKWAGRAESLGPWWVCLVALLFAAGGTAGGSALLLLVGGLVVFLQPPRQKLRRSWLLLAGLLFFWLLLPFVPGTASFSGAWREELESLYALKLPSSLQAQPWLGGEHLVGVVAAVLWFFYVSAGVPDTQRRRVVLRFFALLVILFAALCLFVYYGQFTFPGWSSPRNLGPFENRNQLSSLISVGLLLVVVLLAHDFSRHRVWALVWGLGGILLFYLLVLNYSRAGIVLLFLGGAAWGLVNFLTDKKRGRWALLFLVMSVLLSLFFIYGGATLSRFEGKGKSEPWVGQTRLDIQRDALRMVQDQPVFGVGLGNFAELFPQYREQFQSDAAVRHPESDWLWWTAETGVFGLVLVGGLIVLWLVEVLPLSKGTDRYFRSVCMVGVLMILCHGWVDVPLHRAGVLVPLLFIASLALPQREELRSSQRGRRIWQGLGLAMLVGGVVQLLEVGGWSIRPGEERVRRVLAEIGADAKKWSGADTIEKLSEALKSAPLSWELYFTRASFLLKEGDFVGAREDFRRVRFLEKTSAEVALQESLRWMPVRPDWAIVAAGEAMHRSRHATDVKYGILFDAAKKLGSEELMRELPRVTRSLEGLDYLYLPTVSEEEFTEWMTGERSLKLSKDYRFWPLLKSRWSDEKILTWSETRGDWLKAHFLALSGMRASRGEYEKAYLLIKKEMAAPVLPSFHSEDQKEDDVRKALMQNPQDYVAASQVMQWELAGRHYLSAIQKVEGLLQKPEVPNYFYYLAALAYEGVGDWVKAYQAIHRYELLRSQVNP
jgi:O-antigen ligase